MDWKKVMADANERAGTDLHSGAVTPAYKAKREEVIEALNQGLYEELASIIQYLHHHYMASGIHSPPARELFEELAMNEMKHAERLAYRVRELGGVPVGEPHAKGAASFDLTSAHSLREMLLMDLAGERQAIIYYTELVRFLGDDDIVSRLLAEELLKESEEHAFKLQNLLWEVDAASGKPVKDEHGEQ